MSSQSVPPIKLTAQVACAGCAAKLGQKFLANVLAGLPQASHPNLLVGFSKADDAGIYRISDSQALVQTVDFFPPIVDDPYWFGQIAAANAISDVYAMGGKPLTALNIVGFPIDEMPQSILSEILRGGNDKVLESGAVVVGGHSIKDKELKFGIAVTGLIDPNKIITNAGAREGDVLFLTKALGTGVITTAIKREAVGQSVMDITIQQMASLNKAASELMIRHGAHAATDITGFGLLGHTYEMASASNVTITIFSQKLPILPEAIRLAGAGMNPGGAKDNREYVKDGVKLGTQVDKELEHLLFDPQTSGGLLIAVPERNASSLERSLADAGLFHQPIGRVARFTTHSIVVE